MYNILDIIKGGKQAPVAYIYDAVGYEPSHREKDENGRLIVKHTLITKGCVSPYWGEEIPDWQALGLDPRKKYNVYRPIDELKKAKDLFPNIPVLNKHIMDYANEPQKEYRAGSLSNIDFDGDNVYADVCLWNADDIDNVENCSKKDLSLGYRCKHIKEAGEYNGQPYDLKMVNILPNHLALVEKGRVKGAYVFDEDKNKGEMTMLKKLTSILGGLGVKDEDLKELEEMAEKKVEAKDECDAEHEDKRKLIDEIGGILKGKVDEELWRTIIGKAEKLAYEGSEKSEADDKAIEEKEEKKVEEVKAEEVKKDEEPEEKEEEKAEIDLEKVKEEAKAEARKEMEELAKAKDEVEQVAGKCAVQDSSAAYYKIGLEAMGISVKGIMDEDLRGMFRGACAKTSKGTMDAAPKQNAINETLNKCNLPKRVY